MESGIDGFDGVISQLRVAPDSPFKRVRNAGHLQAVSFKLKPHQPINVDPLLVWRRVPSFSIRSSGERMEPSLSAMLDQLWSAQYNPRQSEIQVRRQGMVRQETRDFP
jgi:hypothetical protein